MFEASVPGVKTYGLAQRVACIGVKFCEYSLAGITCGLLGQGLANSLMMAKWVPGAGDEEERGAGFEGRWVSETGLKGGGAGEQGAWGR